MPISFHIDAAQRLVRMRIWGRIGEEHVRGLCRHLASDPRFRPSFRQLATIDDNVQFTLHPGFIEEAATSALFDAGARRAIVARTEVAFGVAHRFSLIAGRVGQLVRVFHDEDAAELWILAPYAETVITTAPELPRASP